jgi:hypothetical protein
MAWCLIKLRAKFALSYSTWVPAIFRGVKGGPPARKDDNLTAIYEPIT